jgi:tetratricopeptide (TPR) repeat protein
MSIDLLDFEAQGLYFEQAETAEVKALLSSAAEQYGTPEGELTLLRAYFLAPESLNVLVALNRFYYYQHRLQDSLLATEKALAVIRASIQFPEQWQDIQSEHLENAENLTPVRLYLFTLKAIGFLNMRLQRLTDSRAIFEKLVSLDNKDRIGAKALLDLLNESELNV